MGAEVPPGEEGKMNLVDDWMNHHSDDDGDEKEEGEGDMFVQYDGDGDDNGGVGDSKDKSVSAADTDGVSNSGGGGGDSGGGSGSRIADLEAQVAALQQALSVLTNAVRSRGLDPQAMIMRSPSGSMHAGGVGLGPYGGAYGLVGQSSGYNSANGESKSMKMTPSTVQLLKGELEISKVPLAKIAAILKTSRGVTVKVMGLSYAVTSRAVHLRNTVGGKLRGLASLLICGPCRTKPTTRTILKDITTMFEPGEITLLTGPAGCGKSLLLKAIAGRLSLNKTHHVSGTITYNDDKPEGHFSLPKVATYIDQRDSHIAELTVEQTFEFAFQSMSLGTHAFRLGHDLTPEQKQLVAIMDEKNAVVEFVLSKLGLVNARHTIVGNEILRGVSGGERRRVTAGEMMCGPTKVMMFDSISTGLDSSTTFDIITTLKEIAKALNKTIVIALLQPPPEVYELFQNVCVMAEGSIIYQGKREGLLPYFGNLGYECPPRKDIADFIVELPTDIGAMHLQRDSTNHHLTPREFTEKWKSSAEYVTILDEVQKPVQPPADWNPSQIRKEAGSWFFHTKLCFWQQWLLLKGDRAYTRSRLGMVLFMGVIIGTVFISLSFEDYNSKLGVLYYSIMFLALSTTTQVLMGFARRQVMYKHVASGFYGVSNSMVASVIMMLPMQIVEVTLFSPLVYYLAGLDSDPRRFFVFVFIQACLYLNYNQVMRFLAALCPDRARAQGIAFVIVLMTILYSGYMVPPDVIPNYWMWVYKCSPISYAFKAVVINEFTSPKYSVCAVGIPPDTPNCLTYGEAVLDGFGFGTNYSDVWWGALIILAEWLSMSVVTALTLKYCVWDVSDNAPTPKEPTVGHEPAAALADVLGGQGTGIAVGIALGGIGISSSGRMGSDYQDYGHDHDEEGDGGGARRSSSAAAGAGGGGGGGGTAVVADDVELGQQQRAVSAASASIPAVSRRRQTTESESLPFLPVTLAFRDIWYSVPNPGGEGELDLLKGISGYAKPGTMTALMGSSGAGKTTLMDVLAGRKTGKTRGDILLNGYPKVQATYTRIAGYCEQMDIHSPVVTVREALSFSAALRLEYKLINREKREAHVNSVLDLLELQPIEDDVIGSMEGGGLSVEQRKRVTIGVELCANPSLIFADEPTSGLDSRSALVVMKCINAVAQTGRTVVITIHQPSTSIFEMFDHLLLLKKGGDTVYFGDLGPHSQTMIAFLEAMPGTRPYEKEVNPATWMLDIVGAGTSGIVDPQVYADYYKVSELYRKNMQDTDEQCQVRPGVRELVFEHKYAAPPLLQYKACIYRAFCQYWRSPSYSFTKIVLNTVIAVIMGSNFYNVPYDHEAAMFSRLAIFYSSSAFMGIMYYSLPIPFIATERIVFYREQASNMYRPSAFAMGFGVAEIPYNIVSSGCFTSIFYFLATFSPEPDKFFLYWLAFALYCMFQSYMAAFLVNATVSMPVAQNIGTVMNSCYNIFAGFMISPGALSSFWRIFFFLDPLHYTLAASATSQFHDDTTEVLLANGGTTTAKQFVYDTFDGEYVWSNYWYYILALFAFIVAVRFANLYALLFIRHIKR